MAKENGLFSRLRKYFFTGLVVTAPITVTFYIIWVVISFVDNRIKPLIPAPYSPEEYIPFSIPGLGLVIVIIGLTLIGALAAGVFGRLLLNWGERIVEKMPVVRNIYSALKQVFEAVLSTESSSFREVVLVEYPRKDIWSLGFITGTTKGEVQEDTEDNVLNVFIPTTPNPTSGFLLFVPESDVERLDMTVEDGLKMVVSAGIVTPKYPRRKKGTAN